MRLAVLTGEWDVAKMERRLTKKRLEEWEAFAALEPWTFFPEARADWRAASIRETVFNVAVAQKHRRKLKDFVLPFEEETKPKRPQTPAEQLEILRVLSIIHNSSPPES
jgi:hypothetical protein